MTLLSKILKIAKRYSFNAPTKRNPDRIQTLGPNIELETKLNIVSSKDVEIILKNISELGFSKVEHRTERHHFFSNNHIKHSVLILVKNSNEIWVKTKKDRQEINTPNKNIPILMRHEIKIRPQDKTYQKEFEKTISQKYVGSFKKECIDFSFWFENTSFTTTLSLADSKTDSLYQIEFEFDGPKENTRVLNFSEIIQTFEQMLIKIVPSSKITSLNTHTKLEWLLNKIG